MFIYFIGFLLLITGASSLVPQASQEGALHAFKSYSDVATFHYTVPKEVYRATWQFAAFMDGKDCISRKVYIHLQSGSYPIISLNNASFPLNMYSGRNNSIVVTTMTTFNSEATAIVPVNSPEPGDWFVGAYMSHWDEKVQQDGIGHKCRYSIGSVGIWLQANGIQSIPTGHETTLRISQPSTYYKIFIPSGTWNFRVKVWGCNFTISNSKKRLKTCIKALMLQGRTLPIFNHSHSDLMRNLTVNNSYTFTENTPYEDSYYYLLVVSDSIINFNVKVSISECPVKITENSYIRQWISNTTTSLTVHTLSSFKRLNDSESEDYIEQDPCPRRFQLIRVKQIQTFSGVYLFQGKEWLTPWLMLTDIHPVIAQFNILPLVDVGGSLDIGVHLEVDKMSTNQQVFVDICVRRSRVPDRVNGEIICHDRSMMMNLSFNKNNEHLIIPYPQPDTWHIALQTKCFLHEKKVRCDANEILVSLNIRTRQCVFSGAHACGDYGICEEIHRGLLHYTTCSCFGGYRGWGCTDATNVNLRSSLLLSFLMLIFSNAFFLPAIYVAVKRKLFTEGLVYFSTMLFSSLYHACDQKFMTYCITRYEVLQYCDFFSSILAFWVTLVAMARLPLHLIPVCHMIGVLIIAFGVESNKTGLPSILVPLAIGVLIPLGTFTYRFYKTKKRTKPKIYLKLLVGLLLASLGLILYTSVETEANYQYTHSLWHMLIALSLIFLLPSTTPVSEHKIAIKSHNSSESELVNLKDNSDIPVFTIVTDNSESLLSEMH
ncbi:post-GPI attachment to proteins factor 6-like [Chelonus insularis]|uniref:post-GPI attachment to proteins factor 6-like n=1 Tax=Chelonus insularis TaxID=460826 RepID=UPI00158CDF71|nr:post-GPI attachment to proteins factor 6-like [Chelonus insularis]